jgi:hypothetical protein
MPHNITSGLCHSLELGSNTMTYVTKESYVINHYPTKAYATKVCFNSKLVYYVNRTYATKTRVKAYVTQVYNISLRLLSLWFDVNVIKTFICHFRVCVNWANFIEFYVI